jgi:hypothetical protein
MSDVYSDNYAISLPTPAFMHKRPILKLKIYMKIVTYNGISPESLP